MKKWMLGLMFLPLGNVACTQNNSSSSGSADPDRGSVTVVIRGGYLDVEVDADVAPLSLAATVSVDGATVGGMGQLGTAATGRDLFKQRAQGANALRFVVSDTRALKIARNGVVVRIPVVGTPSHAEVRDISASDEQGHNLKLRAFSGTPEMRP